MADPLSIAAIFALAFAGKQLSDRTPVPQEPPPAPHANRQNVTELLNTRYDVGAEATPLNKFNQMKLEHPSFSVIAPMTNVNGEPVRDFRDRQYISGKMNNLSPSTKELVGPGLGVNAETPAYGGYQQLYRVNPINVGEYKLTQLPGRINHAHALNKQPGTVGNLTHHKPETTAYLPARLPPQPGRASGQGGNLSGVRVREEYERTKRVTARATTGYRGDGLGYAPARRTVSALQVAQDPTRNKTDLNNQTYVDLLVNYSKSYLSKVASSRELFPRCCSYL